MHAIIIVGYALVAIGYTAIVIGYLLKWILASGS